MKRIPFTIFLLLTTSFSLFAGDIKLVELKVEYTETPLGIDVIHPRFSWQMYVPQNKRGFKQSAYQLIVTDESGRSVWNSGRVKSDISLNIQYNGSPLAATTRYNWVTIVWDQRGKKHTAKSWFETGLMNSGPHLSGWSGAKWIGGDDEDMVLYSQYLPVFKINFTVQLDEKSKATRAGFIYGANDMRLMDRDKNLFGLENKKNQSYLLIEIDIAPLISKGNAQLHIYRVGYHADDKEKTPYKSYSVPREVIGDRNKYKKHDIKINSILGETQIYINSEDNPVAELNLNPLGRGGDFIAFPVIGDIGFFVAQGQDAYFSNIEIRNFRDPSNVLFAERLDNDSISTFSSVVKNISVVGNSYSVKGGESGTFVVSNPSKNSMPMLRTTFSATEPKITKARLYVTARGIYEMYLNGKRVGEDYFNPGLTQYNKTHLYQTYDVTEFIQPGRNALGAWLGEGWWSGGATYMGQFWNFFGDRQSLLAKLVISYADGKEDIIVTGPETWSYFNGGPIVYGSFFQGEVYDATKEKLIEGWSTASYDASAWNQAIEVELEGHVNSDKSNLKFNMPLVDDYSEMSLMGQFGGTVKKVKELSAKSVEEARPGVFVYDMGQNMVGVPRIDLSGTKAGTKIVLRYAEVKYPDLPAYKKNVGMIMLENIRAAMAQDIYITKGGNEIIHPRFTFHGYRFIEITGIEKPLPLEWVKGIVISSIDKLTSHYETSNEKVNKLWENITWSMFGNFLAIPTDCPQRNERLGWSGDISVFARTATYMANIPQFFRRHLLAMRNVQRQDGRFTDVAPLGGGFGGVLWGSAGITVAWESYLQYGDKQTIEEHYDAMKRYITFVLEKNIDSVSNVLIQENPTSWSNLGDWLGPEQEKNDNSLLWEAYFIFDLEIMGKLAAAIGKKEDERQFRDLYLKRKKFFNEMYIDSGEKKTTHSGFKQHKKTEIQQGDFVNTQTSYVLPLAFDIVDSVSREKMVENFVKTLTTTKEADNETICPPYSLMTGFIGTAWINKALSDYGHSDMAYRLLQQTTYPSWLYPVEQGATTIWERLNSYTHTDGFGGNNGMNSFNHYSFGAIGAWLCAYSLGIERDEHSPGFKHFILQPNPDPTGKMTFAKGFYDSMYGRIEGSWEKRDNSHRYRFVVPANSSATLYLNASSSSAITEGGRPLKTTRGVKYLGKKKLKQGFELQSGEYIIEVTNIGN